MSLYCASWSAGHDSCVKSIYTCKHSKCIHKLNLLTQSDTAYLQVSPVIFNFWFAAGIVISSLVLLVKYPLVSLAAVQPLPCVLHDRILHLTPFISSDIHSIDCCMQHKSATCNPCTAFKPLLPAYIRQIEPKLVIICHYCLCASEHPSLCASEHPSSNNCSYRHSMHSLVAWCATDSCSTAIALRQSGLNPMGNPEWSAADGVNSQHLHSH